MRFVDSSAAGMNVHNTQYCFAFFNPLVSNFKKLRIFSHNQIKHFNANIAMLRIVFHILLEIDLQSSFVRHKVLIDEFLNH